MTKIKLMQLDGKKNPELKKKTFSLTLEQQPQAPKYLSFRPSHEIGAVRLS
jgi:hypothetical protein